VNSPLILKDYYESHYTDAYWVKPILGADGIISHWVKVPKPEHQKSINYERTRIIKNKK
jgi:hypothetical protein